jgi:hypothetical protein
MRKLQLGVDELSVESFVPQGPDSPQGTVVAYETEFWPCGGATECMTCPDWPTCEGGHTCDGQTGCYTQDWRDTCSPTCASSCGAGAHG